MKNSLPLIIIGVVVILGIGVGVVYPDVITNFLSKKTPVIYGIDREPFVGPAEDINNPTNEIVTGIVPVVTLIDSFDKEYKMSSKTISLSVVGSPTIQATRGKLKIGLKAYFDRPDLVDRYGELQSWELTGSVVIGTDCGSDWTVNNLGSFQFQAFGNSKPTQPFSPLISSLGGVIVEDNEAVIILSEWIDNKATVNYGGSVSQLLNWCNSSKDIIRDITISVTYRLKIVGEYEFITLSGKEEVTHLYARWDVPSQTLTFYESGDIYRVEV